MEPLKGHGQDYFISSDVTASRFQFVISIHQQVYCWGKYPANPPNLMSRLDQPPSLEVVGFLTVTAITQTKLSGMPTSTKDKAE